MEQRAVLRNRRRLETTDGDQAALPSEKNFSGRKRRLTPFWHKYPRGQRKAANGYAVWPKGRLVAVAADGLGQFTMIPIMAPGRVLKINAVTQRTGWVKAEVVGVAGRSLAECQPLVGDQHWTQLTWKDGSDLGVEQGQPIILKFELYQARLFGLEFE